MADTVKCKRCGNVVRRKRLAQRFCLEACRAAYEQQMRRKRRASRMHVTYEGGACTPREPPTQPEKTPIISIVCEPHF
jgi:hypothetical protein